VAIYVNRFCNTLDELLEETGVSCYQISQYSGLDGGYLSRLRSGQKKNPSPETIMKISLALVHYSDKVKLFDVEALFKATGRTLLHA